MKDTTSDIGRNKTGIKTSPIDSKDITEESLRAQPSHLGDVSLLLKARQVFIRESEGLGHVPPPASLKGAAKTAMGLLKGSKPTVFFDKVGERIAFERTGVRLYEGVLAKLDVFGSWDGGPSRELLEKIRADELGHFALLTESMESLGGDPTAMTPAADVAAVISMGVPALIADARTNLRQCLHALLVAELTDNASWELLIDLARGLGHDTLAERFQGALDAEAEHLALVKGWLAAGVATEARAKREASKQPPPV